MLLTLAGLEDRALDPAICIPVMLIELAVVFIFVRLLEWLRDNKHDQDNNNDSSKE